MRNTLLLKTLASFTILILIVVFSISTIAYSIFRSFHLETQRKHLTEIFISLNLLVTELVLAGQETDLDILAKQIGQDVKYRITVIEPDGRVIADSEEDPLVMENHSNRPEIITAMQKQMGESIRYSASLESEMLYRAFPLTDGNDQIIGILRVSIFVDQLGDLFLTFRSRIFLFSLIIFLLSVIAAYIYTYHLTKPVREITRATKKISEGNFNVKVLTRNKDEIGQLAVAFNNMSDQLSQIIGELTYQKESLNNIISSMREGLLLIDREDSIKLTNKSFRDIIKDEDVIGKRYWIAIKNPILSEFIRELNEKKKEITREIVIDKTNFLTSGLYNREGEMLILLHNISEIKDIEKIKKDIVENVSHELRSPLTAIKGFLETLESEVKDTGKEFLAIINRNLDRLINIVNDLLTLTQLDKGYHLEKSRFDIADVVKHIARSYEKKVHEKGLSLETLLADDLPIITADEYQIEQLLSNLIDNALQYTESGGIKISVKKEHRFICIYVEDTGSGIAPEHIPRLFERFYVVDKSRSRKYGGTGLGLAIVKHIVLLHDGDVSVKSSPGKGTVFKVKLPV